MLSPGSRRTPAVLTAIANSTSADMVPLQACYTVPFVRVVGNTVHHPLQRARTRLIFSHSSS